MKATALPRLASVTRTCRRSTIPWRLAEAIPDGVRHLHCHGLDGLGGVHLDEGCNQRRDRPVLVAASFERLDRALALAREQDRAGRVEVHDEIGARIDAPEDRAVQALRPRTVLAGKVV